MIVVESLQGISIISIIYVVDLLVMLIAITNRVIGAYFSVLCPPYPRGLGTLYTE
jgi:hypothetical protein